MAKKKSSKKSSKKSKAFRKKQKNKTAKPINSSKLFRQAKEARELAHAPYSKFKVGAAMISDRGQTFTGCNVENASYGGTVCAERVAILKAVSEGVRDFDSIVVVAKSKKLVPPCAMCLQTMAEFCEPDFLIHLADPSGIKKAYRLRELLPYPFNAKYL